MLMLSLFSVNFFVNISEICVRKSRLEGKRITTKFLRLFFFLLKLICS
jgi:hypothetical protein